MKLEELNVYRLSMELGEGVWQAVSNWQFFAMDTIGKQLVRAADSVAANISEGYGRYHYKENKQFCCYARGSLSETMTWLTKAKARFLISEDFHQQLTDQIDTLSVKLNNYIKSIGTSNNRP